MKNPIEMLKEIKNLLGVELSEEVKEPQIVLAQLKLDNGTVIEANDFVEGSDVFILTEDERVALPKGEYQLEDGRTLEIIDDGVINSVEVKADEHEEKEDDEKEMKEQEFVSKDEFDALKDMVMSMKEKMGAYDDKKKMDEEAELKEELSKPAAQPIKHSPEAPQKKKVLYSQNRGATTLDVVMNKIYNKQ